MPHRTLTTDEMQQLDAALRRDTDGYVELHVELLDHLAADIEGQWAQLPGRPLSVALREARRSLGTGGVKSIVRQRQRIVERATIRQALRYYHGMYSGFGGFITLFLAFLITDWLKWDVALPRLGALLFVACWGLFVPVALWLTIQQYRRRRWYAEVVTSLISALLLSVLVQNLLINLPELLLGEGMNDWGKLAYGLFFALLAPAAFVLGVSIPYRALRRYRRCEAQFAPSGSGKGPDQV